MRFLPVIALGILLVGCSDQRGPWGWISDTDGEMLTTRKPENIQAVHGHRLSLKVRKHYPDGDWLIDTRIAEEPVHQDPGSDGEDFGPTWIYPKATVTVHCQPLTGKDLVDFDPQPAETEIRHFFRNTVEYSKNLTISFVTAPPQFATPTPDNPRQTVTLPPKTEVATTSAPAASTSTTSVPADHQDVVVPTATATMPPVATPPKAASQTATTGRSYTVQKGDTLATISALFYGGFERWRDIAKANKLSDPTKIEPGMVLIIPE